MNSSQETARLCLLSLDFRLAIWSSCGRRLSANKPELLKVLLRFRFREGMLCGTKPRVGNVLDPALLYLVAELCPRALSSAEHCHVPGVLARLLVADELCCRVIHARLYQNINGEPSIGTA